jgi:hypothetical protein
MWLHTRVRSSEGPRRDAIAVLAEVENWATGQVTDTRRWTPATCRGVHAEQLASPRVFEVAVKHIRASVRRTTRVRRLGSRHHAAATMAGLGGRPDGRSDASAPNKSANRGQGCRGGAGIRLGSRHS